MTERMISEQASKLPDLGGEDRPGGLDLAQLIDETGICAGGHLVSPAHKPNKTGGKPAIGGEKSRKESRTGFDVPGRFSRKAAAVELRALAEAVRLIGDPSLNIRNRDPHQAMRFKERIAERLERLAGEMKP